MKGGGWRRGKWRNWAGTTVCRPAKLLYPESEEEIIALVRHCHANSIPLKVVGTGHSYNEIFHTDGYLVSLARFNRIEHVDPDTGFVRFQAGLRTVSLNRRIGRWGLALGNLGTNIFDAFVGACSTGYHGSGVGYRIQSDIIEWIELVDGTGEKVRIDRSHDDFHAVAVGLGAFGVVLRVCIRCEPAFNLEITERPCTLAELKDSLEALKAGNEHFKVLWIPHTERYVVWTGNRTRRAEASAWGKWKKFFLYGILVNNFFHELLLGLAVRWRSLVPRINRLMARILHGDTQIAVLGSKWAFMLPHVLKQEAMEYAIPDSDALACLDELQRRIREGGFHVDTCIEIRFVRDDGFWLSPAYGRPSCYIGTKVHFPFRMRPAYRAYFREFEAVMRSYSGRPHWGKDFEVRPGDLQDCYPRWDEYWGLVDRYDPRHIFQNAFLKRLRPS